MLAAGLEMLNAGLGMLGAENFMLNADFAVIATELVHEKMNQGFSCLFLSHHLPAAPAFARILRFCDSMAGRHWHIAPAVKLKPFSSNCRRRISHIVSANSPSVGGLLCWIESELRTTVRKILSRSSG